MRMDMDHIHILCGAHPKMSPGSVVQIIESLEPAILSRFSKNAIRTKEKFSWRRMAEIVTNLKR